MERILCLVLDEDAKIKLPLFEGTNDEIDKYTTKFDNAENLRAKYKKEIDAFLEKNHAFLDSRDPEKKKYYGRIVVLEDHGSFCEQKRVLFKKHLIAFKNFIYKDKATLQEFAHLQKIGYQQFNKKRLLSPYMLNKISYSGTFSCKSRIEELKRDLNKDDDFYDILRIIIKAYKHQRELRPNLPTIESIYSEYVETKKAQKEAKKIEQEELRQAVTVVPKPIVDDDEVIFVINGMRYSADEMHLFDLEDIDIETSNLIPDGIGFDEKTRK